MIERGTAAEVTPIRQIGDQHFPVGKITEMLFNDYEALVRMPPEEVSKRHYHDVDFQMVYVLKGWIKTELDGQGAIVMRQGSAWIQPPRIEHVVLDYSDDCEVLEVILPADFETVELE